MNPALRERLDSLVADLLGLAGHEPAAPARTDERKLVTFVPVDDLDAVREALFAAGAGVIGDYTRCSGWVEVTGTFYGTEGTEPAVGETGREEAVPEIRLETIYPLVNVRWNRMEGRVGTLDGDAVDRLDWVGAGPAYRRRLTSGTRVAVFTGLPGPVVADCVIAPAGDPDGWHRVTRRGRSSASATVLRQATV